MQCRFQRYIDGLEDFEKEFYQKDFDKWNDKTLSDAHMIADILEKSGCKEPEGWVFSEIDENLAQVARFAFLKQLWGRVIESSAVNLLPDLEQSDDVCAGAMKKLDAVLTPIEKERIFQKFSALLGFDFVHMLDEGFCDLNEQLPGWKLMEVNPITEALTGRDVGGLHESYLDEEFGAS